VVRTVTLHGERLTVRTTVTAGDAPVPIAFGFHPYLRLPGTPRAAWRVTVPACRRLHLDQRGLPDGGGRPFALADEPLGARSFDDCLVRLAEPRRFALADGRRRLTVELLDGYPAAQLFAPADQELVCFEPMAAPTNALVSGHGLAWAPPGAAVGAAWALTVAAR